jgi:hypothetical protein
VYYRQLLKNEEAAKELDSLFEEIDKIEAYHIYSVDYFRENGPKKAENYVSPQDYVKNLENRVNAAIEDVAKKYSS